MARTPDYKFLERSLDPAILDKFANDESLWYETAAEKREGFREGRRRKRIFRRVRKLMVEGLTEKQQFCVKEHFLEGKSMRRIAAEQGLHFSTVAQHVKAGIRRLRKALL